jgi:hypothetical protein
MLGLTYNSLLTTVLSYIKRSQDQDTLAIFPTWVGLAESRISRELKFLVNKTVVTGNFTTGSAVVVKPSNWRLTFGINYGTGTNNNTRVPLFPRSYESARTYWPDDTQTSPPLYYCDYDYQHYLIVPTPDQGYPFELSYYGDPANLSPAVQTNWYTQEVPDLLLYATLLEAPSYLKNPDTLPMWQQMYQSALAAYNAEQKGREIDQSLLRTDGT